jgi:hypothetical protein
MQQGMQQMMQAVQQLTRKQEGSDQTIGELKSNLQMITQLLAGKAGGGGGPQLPPMAPTQAGQVAPDIPVGAGAPDLGGMPIG